MIAITILSIEGFMIATNKMAKTKEGIVWKISVTLIRALMRVTEIFQTIPSFVFAILLVAIMKPSIESIVIAITVVS